MEQSVQTKTSVEAGEEQENEAEQQEELEETEQQPPLFEFDGKIHYCTDFIDCTLICTELLHTVVSSYDFLVLGFGITWQSSNKHKTALIQICPNLEKCYIFHITEIKSVPQNFNLLLVHPKTRIAAINKRSDIRKLSEEFDVFKAEQILANCIDGTAFAREVLPRPYIWTVEELVEYLFGSIFDKNSEIRRSEWHVSPLSREQLKYAATSAYAGLLIYTELKRREEITKSGKNEPEVVINGNLAALISRMVKNKQEEYSNTKTNSYEQLN